MVLVAVAAGAARHWALQRVYPCLMKMMTLLCLMFQRSMAMMIAKVCYTVCSELMLSQLLKIFWATYRKNRRSYSGSNKMLCLSLKIDCKISLATNHTFQYLMFTRIQDILAVSHHVANLVLVSVGIPWYFHRLFTLNKWVGNSRIGFQCSNATIALKVNKLPKQRFFLLFTL